MLMILMSDVDDTIMGMLISVGDDDDEDVVDDHDDECC